MKKDEKTDKNSIKSYIKSGQALLRYNSYGKGFPLILLHGNMQNSRYFERQIEFFKEYYRVIAVDSRGHGDSSFGLKKLSIALMADDVLNLMDTLEIPQAFVLGFSDGGNIALQLALTAPEKILALVAVSPNLNPTEMKAWINLPIQLLYGVCHLLSSMEWFDKKAQLLSLMAKGPGITTQNLIQISLPALIISGEFDIIQYRHIKLIADSIPGSKLEIIKSRGHSLLHSGHKLVNTMILEFFRLKKD